jgi:hypothetical protein
MATAIFVGRNEEMGRITRSSMRLPLSPSRALPYCLAHPASASRG